MSDNISRQSAIDALRAIRSGLWEIDIPSPAGCPEYVEHHEQIQHMMGVVDGWIKKISEEEPTDHNGHWVSNGRGGYNCSECGGFALDDVDECFVHGAVKSDYCPACGADMRGGEVE